jgi:hypothetical protein
MWKETLVALLRVYIQICLEGVRKSKQKIQTRYITRRVLLSVCRFCTVNSSYCSHLD